MKQLQPIIGFAAIFLLLMPYQATLSAVPNTAHTRTPASLQASALGSTHSSSVEALNREVRDSAFALARELTTHEMPLLVRRGNTPAFVRLTSLDLTNGAVLQQINADQTAGTISGSLLGGTVILTPRDLASKLTAEDIPASITVTFMGFKSSNPVVVDLTASSTTSQVIIDGSETFTGTSAKSAAVLKITSNQAEPALVTTGALSSDGSMSITSNESMQFGGPVTAATTLEITATQGAIAVNNALTAVNPAQTPTTITVSAKGTLTAVTAPGFISVAPFNLSGIFGAFQATTLNLMTGGGDIAASGGPAFTNATTINTTIKGPGTGSAYLWDANSTSASGITLGTISVGGTFSLLTTGSDPALAYGSITCGAISASTVSLTTQGANSSITLTKSWGNANTTINLSAGGLGNISEAKTTDALTGSTLNLTTDDGNVAGLSFPNPFLTSVAVLSVSVSDSSAAVAIPTISLSNKTNLSLTSAICAGQTSLTVNTKGTMSVDGVVSAQFSLTLQASSNLTINAGIGATPSVQTTIISGGILTVNNTIISSGSLTLEGSNTSAGKIVIAEGITILSLSSSINVVIGPVPSPSSLVPGTTPINAQLGAPPNNFPIFYGAKGFTVTGGCCVTLDTPNGIIVINTGTAPVSAISIGNLSTLSAGYLTTISDDSLDIVNTGDDGQPDSELAQSY